MDSELEGKFCVVSIFLSFFNQHEQYIPFSGVRIYEETLPISTFNKPMLKVEKDLLKGILNPEFQEDYLRKNGREVSEIYAYNLGQKYYIVRIGDYDVDCLINYQQHNGLQSMSFLQNDRFGKISYGSACLLVIPIYDEPGFCQFKLRPEAQVGMVVKCKQDAIIDIVYPNGNK